MQHSPSEIQHTEPGKGRGEGPRLLFVCLVPVFLLAVGCSPGYVLRAGYEEAKILWRREPIERVLQRGDLDPATRAKLELVLAVRGFARDALQLRVDASYATFARVDADQVVHVVSAAYRLRLEPYTWWFPIVGRVPYKGFFSRTAADEEAASLEGSGYDTYVRPSVAFSTLGWFADPLLSNLLRYDRSTLADVIIHELLHNTSYLAGQAEFDESFANFVGLQGAIAFFAAQGDEEGRASATVAWDDALRFSDFLGRFTSRLRDAYAAGVTLTERQRLFAQAQEEFNHWAQRPQSYRDFGTERLNNAVILQYLMYTDRLHLFQAALERQQGDLRRTIRMVLDAVHRDAKNPFATLQNLPEPAHPEVLAERSSVESLGTSATRCRTCEPECLVLTARASPDAGRRTARSRGRPPASA